MILNGNLLVLSVIPEPGSWALLILGSCVLLWVQRNRKNTSVLLSQK
jgi:hypothetical protein